TVITVDLERQQAGDHDFAIDAEAKAMLIEGLDVIDLTLKHKGAIADWQTHDRKARPWVYLSQIPLHHPADGPPPQGNLGEVHDRSNPPQSKSQAAYDRADPPQSLIGEGDHPQGGGGVSKLPPKTNETVVRARKLRRAMSLPENMLWVQLRQRPAGFKFRRQHPAGPYVLDFFCAAAKLCVELDGEAHNRGNAPQQDARRDAFLARHDICTVRIAATEVLRDMNSVVAHVVQAASGRIPLHHPADGPPPQGNLGEVHDRADPPQSLIGEGDHPQGGGGVSPPMSKGART
ncbi:MAG: hypothetical protein RLZZ58_2039, partial [Pseudomonadota bacterium]